MNKHWVIVGIIVFIFALANTGLYFWSKLQKPVVKPEGSQLSTSVPTPPPASQKTWDDPAGFTFQYPERLIINKHEEDNENYAHVELTDANHKGNVIVWVKDAPKGKNRKVVTSLSEWIESDTRFDSANILDTSLGGKPAKKILLQIPQKMIIVGTVSDGLLFTIDGDLSDAEYWTPLSSGIADSFKFTTPKDPETVSQPAGTSTQTVVTDSGSGGEEAVDEEEIIE